MNLKRNCDNCNFGSYNLDCSEGGKETLYCKESEYEREVKPTDVCECHMFMDGYRPENKKFLKRLTKEQLKILILLVINKHEKEQHQSYSTVYKSLANVRLNCSPENEWDEEDKVYVQAKIGTKRFYYSPCFLIDDTEIEMREGILKKEYNVVLQQYFAQVFGTEYIEFLYKFKLDELNEEKENLIKVSEGPSLKKKIPNINI